MSGRYPIDYLNRELSVSALTKLNTYLDILPHAVKSQMQIVETKDLPGPLLHISTNANVKEFTPYITRRTANKEDRTVPRVSTAPTLLGCLKGFMLGWDVFFWPDAKGKKTLLQSWTVYGFDTPLAIRPTSKLLYDVNTTDEHWLVGYSKEAQSYVPTKLAKGFYREVLLIGRPNQNPFKVVTMVIEVYDTSIQFAKGVTLTKGYWKVVGPDALYRTTWVNAKPYTVTEITKTEFNYLPTSQYQVSTEDAFLPSFMKW